MSETLLEVEGLRTWFSLRGGLLSRTKAEIRAVDGISFSLATQEVLGICGESGSGKSTLGRSVLRLIEPTDGRITFAGSDLRALGPRGLRAFRRQAQMIFQDPYGALNPRMTIESVLAEPLRLQGLVRGRRAQRERSAELLETVALSPDFLRRRPQELSGGQRQRVVIARALAVGPRLVVADEPVSALDVSIQAQIVALLNDLKQRLRLSMLFISHDLAVMEYLSDRIAVVYLGKLMELGPASAICTRPRHPYTRALLSSALSSRKRGAGGRIILKGELPSPSDPPSGCVFRTRCPFALPACAEDLPVLRSVAPGQQMACIRDDLPDHPGTDPGGAGR